MKIRNRAIGLPPERIVNNGLDSQRETVKRLLESFPDASDFFISKLAECDPKVVGRIRSELQA